MKKELLLSDAFRKSFPDLVFKAKMVSKIFAVSSNICLGEGLLIIV
jgi:hypothetical protein